MNFNESLVLVAPRPVRLAAPTTPVHFSHFHSAIQRPQARTANLVSAHADTLDRVKPGADVPEDENKATEPFEPVSTRPSPRSTPPSEALEEFLSILNPSAFFPPSSPVLRPANANTPHTRAFFSYRQPTSCSISPSLPSEGLGLAFVGHTADDRKENDTVAYPFKLLGYGPLASPVSRSHTRNPFQRHPSYDGPASAMFHPGSTDPSPPSPMLIAPSPAAIPLPLPTADELELDASL
ncbi:hypothetical protein B0H21DRAFT_718427 [Amylocystis lapponica]|nr:hypothetical protein B0H21DRAFT_718427 [Amylocystis lapponica]